MPNPAIVGAIANGVASIGGSIANATANRKANEQNAIATARANARNEVNAKKAYDLNSLNSQISQAKLARVNPYSLFQSGAIAGSASAPAATPSTFSSADFNSPFQAVGAGFNNVGFALQNERMQMEMQERAFSQELETQAFEHAQQTMLRWMDVQQDDKHLAENIREFDKNYSIALNNYSLALRKQGFDEEFSKLNYDLNKRNLELLENNAFVNNRKTQLESDLLIDSVKQQQLQTRYQSTVKPIFDSLSSGYADKGSFVRELMNDNDKLQRVLTRFQDDGLTFNDLQYWISQENIDANVVNGFLRQVGKFVDTSSGLFSLYKGARQLQQTDQLLQQGQQRIDNDTKRIDLDRRRQDYFEESDKTRLDQNDRRLDQTDEIYKVGTFRQSGRSTRSEDFRSTESRIDESEQKWQNYSHGKSSFDRLVEQAHQDFGIPLDELEKMSAFEIAGLWNR